MKKLLLPLFIISPFAFANTPDACLAIETDTERLQCYDTYFKKETKSESNNVEETAKASWEYSEQKDEMRNSSTYYAINISLNEVQFDFPYQGGSNAFITLRKDKEFGDDIIIGVSKGQFNSCIRNCKIAVKFDDEKVENYTVVGNNSFTNDTLFLSGNKSIKKFADKLKTSKKVVVELDFFQRGREQFSFSIEGLDWKHF
ncbi:hypothetical protein [Mannheimia indoligenes]|uniref:hypothetical protein n=1 Tax=Mannheimia indoligenes TaxID=3103145 RepID=UPI002FE684BA